MRQTKSPWPEIPYLHFDSPKMTQSPKLCSETSHHGRKFPISTLTHLKLPNSERGKGKRGKGEQGKGEKYMGEWDKSERSKGRESMGRVASKDFLFHFIII